MVVLFDHGTPKGLIRALPGHTAQSKGWGTLSNGALLDAAEEAGFDLLLTTDRRIRYQQNLKTRRIALVVLTGSTKWSLVRRHADRIASAIATAAPGSYSEVVIPFEPSAVGVERQGSLRPATLARTVTRLGGDSIPVCGRPFQPAQVIEQTRPIDGEPNVHELEPDRCVAEAVGRAPRRGVKLILRRFRFRQTQEYENGAVERLHFFGGQRADQPSEASPRHGSQLVHHHPAWCTQSAPGTGLDGKPEDRGRRRIGRQGAHDDRIVRVEPIVLDDDGGSRLAGIGRSTRDGPDLATFHPSFQAEMASTNDWSCLA